MARPCNISDRSVAQEKQQKGQLETQVISNKDCLKNILTNNLQCQTLVFTAGQVKNHLFKCESITQDPIILSAIQHYNIEFEDGPPLQTNPPKNTIFSLSEKEIISNEIAKLLTKRVIGRAIYRPDSYLSNVNINL